MAVPAITAATIASAGYYATLRITNATITGGATPVTYSLGTAPANYKCVFTVTSKGFDATGAATTIVRTVYGRFIRYKEAPPANSYAKDETTQGSDIDVTIALSEPIYVKDNTGAGNSGTAVTCAIAAAFATTSGGASLAATPTVTNSSTLAYPKAVARFLTLPYSGSNTTAAAVIGSGSFSVDIAAFAMYGIACVKTTLADGTVTRNQTLTSYTSGENFYRCTDTGSNFTQSANVTCRAIAYPMVGDTTEVRDSNDNSFAASRRFATLPLGVCDKGGTYGVSYIVVDPVSGNDTNTNVYTSQAAAEAGNAVQTIAKALKRIQDFNNSTYSRNTVDGGVVLLKAGGATYGVGGETISSHTGTACTITRASNTTRANAQIVGPNGSGRYGCKLTRLYDMSVVAPDNTNQLIGFFGTNYVCAISDCTFTGAGGGNRPFSGNNAEGHLWWNSVTMTGYTTGFSGGNDCNANLARDCTCTAAAGFKTIPALLDCTSNGATITAIDPSSALDATNTNNVCMNVRVMSCTNTPMAQSLDISDTFFVNCVLEALSGIGSSAAIEVSDMTMDNIHWWNVTVAGQRVNIENDIVAALVDKTTTNYSIRGMVTNSTYNVQSHSDDTAMSLVGHRAIQYGVVSRDCHQESDSLNLDPWPRDYGFTHGSSCGFASDKSALGTDAGGGDYTPSVGSVLLNRVSSPVVQYDLYGRRLSTDSTYPAAIGAIQLAPIIRFTVDAVAYDDADTVSVTAGSVTVDIDLANYADGAAMEIVAAQVSGTLSGLSAGTGVTQGTTVVTATFTAAAGSGTLTLTDSAGVQYTLDFTVAPSGSLIRLGSLTGGIKDLTGV